MKYEIRRLKGSKLWVIYCPNGDTLFDMSFQWAVDLMGIHTRLPDVARRLSLEDV